MKPPEERVNTESLKGESIARQINTLMLPLLKRDSRKRAYASSKKYNVPVLARRDFARRVGRC
jgi:hypothetical protein